MIYEDFRKIGEYGEPECTKSLTRVYSTENRRD